MANYPKEKTIENTIRSFLKSIGAKIIKIHGSAFTQAGIPDLIGCYAGRTLAFEVKKPGGRLTKLQDHELAEWRKAGAIAGKVESVEDVKNLLKGEVNE